MLAAAMLLFNACSKKDSDVVTSDNTWSLGSITHYVNTTAKTGGNTIVFNDSGDGHKGTLTVTFKTFPTAAGTYQLVPKTVLALGDKQCQVSTTDASGTTYDFATGTANVAISFNVKDQLSIAIPEITVANTPANTLKLAATVYDED